MVTNFDHAVRALLLISNQDHFSSIFPEGNRAEIIEELRVATNVLQSITFKMAKEPNLAVMLDQVKDLPPDQW